LKLGLFYFFADRIYFGNKRKYKNPVINFLMCYVDNSSTFLYPTPGNDVGLITLRVG